MKKVAFVGLLLLLLSGCASKEVFESLADDYGKALKSGAHLSSLRRTKIGDFNVNNAIDAASFKDLLEKNTAP